MKKVSELRKLYKMIKTRQYEEIGKFVTEHKWILDTLTIADRKNLNSIIETKNLSEIGRFFHKIHS